MIPKRTSQTLAHGGGTRGGARPRDTASALGSLSGIAGGEKGACLIAVPVCAHRDDPLLGERQHKKIAVPGLADARTVDTGRADDHQDLANTDPASRASFAGNRPAMKSPGGFTSYSVPYLTVALTSILSHPPRSRQPS